jgi:transposase
MEVGGEPLHRTRDLLVRQRTGAINALRGQMGEFGTVTAKGTAKARELMALVASEERIPALARGLWLVEQIQVNSK